LLPIATSTGNCEDGPKSTDANIDSTNNDEHNSVEILDVVKNDYNMMIHANKDVVKKNVKGYEIANQQVHFFPIYSKLVSSKRTKSKSRKKPSFILSQKESNQCRIFIIINCNNLLFLKGIFKKIPAIKFLNHLALHLKLEVVDGYDIIGSDMTSS
jgi:hypothetical protein